MPSAYLLVHAAAPGAARQILLGNKNIIGVRLQGLAHAQMIWNSAGQRVISGGRMNPGEANDVAAMREFFEETNIDFRLPATRVLYGYVAHNTFVNPGGQFSVTYVEITAAHQAALANAITQNIANNAPRDDELHDVLWTPRAGAAAQFAVSPNPPVPGSWQQAQFNAVLPGNIARRNEQMAAPFDWFVTGVNNCPP